MENSNEITDTLSHTGYKIIQNPQKFKFGIDAFLLSWFCHSEIRNNQTVCDLGTGTGIIPFLLSASSRAVKLTGLEIQSESADMARRSVELNGLQEKISIVQGDIKKVPELFKKYSFDVVTSNPPFMISDAGKQNPSDAKAIARFEVLCNLEDVISAAEYLLDNNHGVFYMIHRPFRLAEIFSLLQKHHMEPKRMRLVHPFTDEAPNLVLIEARKNARSRITIEKPLVVYETPGNYTEEIKNIYKEL